jgi:hypothetical protein
MAAWTADELDRIGRAMELAVASRRADGTLSPYVTIWGVRSGDDIYIRSTITGRSASETGYWSTTSVPTEPTGVAAGTSLRRKVRPSGPSTTRCRRR